MYCVHISLYMNQAETHCFYNFLFMDQVYIHCVQTFLDRDQAILLGHTLFFTDIMHVSWTILFSEGPRFFFGFMFISLWI